MSLAPWYAIPTATTEKAEECFEYWKEMGYRTAAYQPRRNAPPRNADVVIFESEWRGWPVAIDAICRTLDGPIIVTGGDDMYPDLELRAEEIAEQFLERFPDTFGVMQPTGDRWMLDEEGKVAAERICGSPWLGRSFIERINGGKGVFWSEYFHFYADEELKEVAEQLGVLWQRPDLTQHHDHWTRTGKNRPGYLARAKEQWKSDQAIFNRRKAEGFPGHEPLPSAKHEEYLI